MDPPFTQTIRHPLGVGAVAVERDHPPAGVRLVDGSEHFSQQLLSVDRSSRRSATPLSSVNFRSALNPAIVSAFGSEDRTALKTPKL